MSDAPSAPACDRIVIVGVGLIGGSLALALRAAGFVREVIGVGRSAANLAAARELRIVDRTLAQSDDWIREVEGADLVVLATPLARFDSLFAALAGKLGPRTLITDVGSTKETVVAKARRLLGADFARFVPGHPIAGSEETGAKAAVATLFRGRTTVLSASPETDPVAIARVRAMWEATGATIVTLDAHAHDRALAVVSHLPHVAAFAFVNAIAARADAADLLRLAGTGFRDFTRIAASSPEIWRDIALDNAGALTAEIDVLSAELRRIRDAIAARDVAAIDAAFGRASALRRAFGSRNRAAATPDA